MVKLPSVRVSAEPILEFGLADGQSVFLELQEGSQSHCHGTDGWSVRGVHI